MGVSFAAWLVFSKQAWKIAMWWERNFYPDVQMIANDLHSKGLLQAGKYLIDIDW